MTKVTMPEPVTHYRGMQYYTAKMLEAYAAARVREALKEAAELCDRFAERDMHPEECAGAIRALIPKEPT